jgi:hypothetical protein
MCVLVGAEQQMADLVRHCQPCQRRAVGAGFAGEPLHAIDVHRRQLAVVLARVDQRVSKLQLSASGQRCRQSNEAHCQLGRRERLFAGSACIRIPARHPFDVDAGGGQHAGCRTQSSPLALRRHFRGVIESHPHQGASPAVFDRG